MVKFKYPKNLKEHQRDAQPGSACRHGGEYQGGAAVYPRTTGRIAPRRADQAGGQVQDNAVDEEDTDEDLSESAERPNPRSYSSEESDKRSPYQSSTGYSSQEFDDYDDEGVDYAAGSVDGGQFEAPVDEEHPDMYWAEASANHAWFVKNSDVNWADKRTNPTWPFPSYSHALLYCWVVTAGTPITTSMFNLLLLLLQDPKFNPREDLKGVEDHRSFFRRTEKHLPISKPASETVPQKLVVRRTLERQGSLSGGSGVRRAIQRVVVACTVDGTSIIDIVKRVYATPSIRQRLRDVVYEDPGDAAPTQFNQTPFCKEPLKYMQLRTFFHRTDGDEGLAGGGGGRSEVEEFRVDDVVKLQDGTVMRIDKLTYRAPDLGNRRSVNAAGEGHDIFPVLVITGPVFRPAAGEHICSLDQVVSKEARKIAKKLTVGQYDDDPDIVCATECSATGTLRAYSPQTTPLTFPGGGGNFLWLAVYIDAMGTTTKHGKSTEGIYLQVCNVDKEIYGTRDTIFTLKLVPKGVDLDAALATVRAQLSALAAGIQVYDVARDAVVSVRCGIASFPADHLQAVATCRGISVNSNVSGRGCHLSRDDYARHDIDCREHGLRRRGSQTDCIVDTMVNQCERLQLKKTPAKAMRTVYGTSPVPSMWRGVTCDPHVQSWTDAAHLIWFGLYPDICKAVVQLMTGAERSELTVRLQHFPWPRGVSAPLLIAKDVASNRKGKGTGIFGTGVTMDGWKNLAYASQSCYDGLCTKSNLQLLVDVTRFGARIFQPLTAQDCEELEAAARGIIRRAWGARGLLHADQPTGKPNTHNLLELTLHTLPALRSAIWADCRPLEGHHQVHKAAMAGRRGGRGGDNGQSKAMVWYARQVCVRLLLGGMVWHTQSGEKLEMNPALRGARDFREGREHLPHPVVTAITNLTPKQHELHIADSGGWVPGVLEKEQPIACMDMSLRTHIRDASERAGLRAIFDKDGTVLPGCDSARFRACRALAGEDDGRQREVSVGDDVACTYGDKPAWYTIKRILVVWAHEEVRVWLWPEWWWNVRRAGADARHPVRQTMLVQRANPQHVEEEGLEEWTCVQPTHLIGQVSIVHSCKREGQNNRAAGARVCRVVSECPQHGTQHAHATGCATPGCGRKARRSDQHDLTNTCWEVFDQAAGYTPGATKVRRHDMWLR